MLERIRQARIERDETEEELAMLIDAAVIRGLGWPQIAAQLGMTRQGARQRYQRRQGSGHQRSHVAWPRGGACEASNELLNIRCRTPVSQDGLPEAT